MVRATKSNTQANKGQYRCPVCRSNHRLAFCREMRRMEPAERLRAVLVHRHCANCLSPHHTAKNCASPRKCEHCRDRHHSLLHLGEAPRDEEDVLLGLVEPEIRQRRPFRPYTIRPLAETSDEGEVLEIDADEEDLQQALGDDPELSAPPAFRPALSGVRSVVQRAPATRSKRRGAHRRQRRSQQQPHRRGVRDARDRITGTARSAPRLSVLTPTVAVKVMTRGRTQVVRAIVDPAQPRSTISLQLARQLRVLPQGYADVCRLTLKGWHERLDICADVQPRLSRVTPPRTLDARITNEFDNFRLADPGFYKSSAVSLVLGAEIYAMILRPGLMPATPTRPTAQNTMFGWMISGGTIY
ncbi:uncharacterized protein LOC118755629 isoform X2 [Rhagoletis pomonella]|uniref:uncharacterized protein LOC118755629 isoform X2 n=1 Tax=Rhagoletis pomonella TaxID=28610 RepID=UPI00177B6E24|nr:uncharacterized protein LOC118755629 isoform X2 [Rhagoletis pomonella]